MFVVTTNDMPGWRVEAVVGEVFGLTVRARNVGAQMGAGWKAMFGGELKGLTQQLQQTRDEAMSRMIGAAEARGANAVLAMRYDSNEIADGWQELVAYGTAVVAIRPDSDMARAQLAQTQVQPSVATAEDEQNAAQQYAARRARHQLPWLGAAGFGVGVLRG